MRWSVHADPLVLRGNLVGPTSGRPTEAQGDAVASPLAGKFCEKAGLRPSFGATVLHPRCVARLFKTRKMTWVHLFAAQTTPSL